MKNVRILIHFFFVFRCFVWLEQFEIVAMVVMVVASVIDRNCILIRPDGPKFDQSFCIDSNASRGSHETLCHPQTLPLLRAAASTAAIDSIATKHSFCLVFKRSTPHCSHSKMNKRTTNHKKNERKKNAIPITLDDRIYA